MTGWRSASRLYRLHLGVGLVALALVAGTVILVSARIDLTVPSLASVAAACDRWLAAAGSGAFAALAVALLALASLVLGIRSALRQLSAGRRYLAALSVGDEVTVEGTTCRVVEADDPRAFCAGYLRPRVYLSSGALRTLTRDELRAVVSHELHHARRRDPLRLLLARSLASALFFIPLLRRSGERYAALCELAADEAAVNRLEGRGALASALLKFDRPEALPATVVGIAPERVDHLMGDPRSGRWLLSGPIAAASVAGLAGLTLVFAAAANGVLFANLDLAVLLAAACMAAMIAGPIALALAGVVLSLRLRTRRA